MARVDEVAQLVGSAVQHLRRVVVARVVGLPLGSPVLSRRQELDGIEIQAADVVELGLELPKAGRAAIRVREDRLAISTARERADVRLIDDEVLEGRRPERRRPDEGRGIRDERRLPGV